MGLLHEFKDVTTEEQALMSALRQQPLSIGVDGGQSPRQFYKTVVITATCETKHDHGVLAVGHGIERGTDDWKVKITFWGAAAGASRVAPDSSEGRVSGRMWLLVWYSIVSCRVLVSIASTSISKPITTCVTCTHSFAFLLL